VTSDVILQFPSVQPPMQCVLGALSLGLKLPGREADHPKNMWSYTSTPPVHLYGVVLNEAADTSSRHGP